jgi:outer membrane protein TolC
MSTEADVLTLSAQVAGLEQRVIESTGEAAIARAELNRLMGGPVTRTYDLREPAEDESSMSGDANLDALLAEAERNRPELRRAGAAERLADTDRRSVRAALLPEVAAQAGFEASGLRFAERTPAWLVGGEVRWNLSLGGAELARLKAMTEAQARAAAEAEDVRATVQVEVVTALRRLEAARARRTAGRAAVEQARESQRIIRDRFDAGVAGVTDVLRASSAVLDAEAQRVSAVVDTVVSAAMLNRAVGRHP